jgi:hypothetical protein
MPVEISGLSVLRQRRRRAGLNVATVHKGERRSGSEGEKQGKAKIRFAPLSRQQGSRRYRRLRRAGSTGAGLAAREMVGGTDNGAELGAE